MSLSSLAAGRKGPLVIVMGACSTDPDAFVGKDIQLGKSVEWQVSDDVPGRRGSSNDFVDPLEVIEAFQDSPVPGVFISRQEAAVFLRDVMLRISGVALRDLEITPDAPFYTSDLSIDDGAGPAAAGIIRAACLDAGLGPVADDAETLLRAITRPGGRAPAAEEVAAAAASLKLLDEEDVIRFQKSFTAALQPHLPGQLAHGIADQRAETPFEELKLLTEVLAKGKTSITVDFEGEHGDEEVSLGPDEGFFSQTYGDRLMNLADVILATELGPMWAEDAGASGRIIFDKDGAFISGDDRRGDWVMERAFDDDDLEGVDWPDQEAAELGM